MLYNSIISRTPLKGGWTPDRKYRAVSADGTPYFLRIGPADRAERLEQVFRLQKQAAELGLPLARPLERGPCAEGFYTLESWIEGIDARGAIPTRTEAQLYADGLLAGETLRGIHSIPAPPELPTWADRYIAKLRRRVEEYRACPLKYEKDEAILSGIDLHRELLSGRPQCFQHGDFHAGNFMYVDGKLTVIDFDRCGFGDPWEEFKKIPWCVEASPALARGLVDGYFGCPPPEEFWQLLHLYLCRGLLSNLPWAIPYGPEEVQIMRRQAVTVMGWYRDGLIPAWSRG